MSITNPYAAQPVIDSLDIGSFGAKPDVEEKVVSVPSGTVPEVLAWVDGNVGRATMALEVELDGAKRKSLIATLEGIIG